MITTEGKKILALFKSICKLKSFAIYTECQWIYWFQTDDLSNNYNSSSSPLIITTALRQFHDMDTLPAMLEPTEHNGATSTALLVN